MDLLNVVSSSWCPYYQKQFEESKDRYGKLNQNLMFVKCQFKETKMTENGLTQISLYVCEKCSYTLTIFSMKESRCAKNG